VPAAEVKDPFSFKSDIFPETVRNYWVYVPSQNDAAKPAFLMVIQDGLSLTKRWKLPTTFDNLTLHSPIASPISTCIPHLTPK
jgi:enterochelin esterase family protein